MTVVSPSRSPRRTSPSAATFASSADCSYTAIRDTSRREPSEKTAVALIFASRAGSTSTCCEGVTSSFWSDGTFGSSRSAPAASHPRITAYSGESLRNLRPPSCGSCVVAF